MPGRYCLLLPITCASGNRVIALAILAVKSPGGCSWQTSFLPDPCTEKKSLCSPSLSLAIFPHCVTNAKEACKGTGEAIRLAVEGRHHRPRMEQRCSPSSLISQNVGSFHCSQHMPTPCFSSWCVCCPLARKG